MMARDPRRCLILASRSPRRLSLLAEAGWQVNVAPADVDETWPHGKSLEQGTCEVALRKARSVSRWHEGSPVLGADTVVSVSGRVIGKPTSRVHARELLSELSGVTHEVVSGVALVCGSESWTGSERSRVRFRRLSPADIDRYLDSADWTDKAGAYGIQEEGGTLVESWEGRFDTIVGLPLCTVEHLWSQMRARCDSLR